MINPDELIKVAAVLRNQTQQIVTLISPRAALERGSPATAEQIALATVDSMGLVCYAMALLITEVVAVLQDNPVYTPEGEKH